MYQAIGFFLASPSGAEITPDNLTAYRHGSAPPYLEYVKPLFGGRQWEEYRLSSDVPLANELAEEATAGKFQYRVIGVRSRAKIILLSGRRRITDYVVEKVLDQAIFPNLRKVSIHIDQLIQFCMKPESEFLITSLHGRFAGPERQIRAMSLYGSDVTDTNLFRANRHLFNFLSCGVGRRLYQGLPRLSATDDGQIVRLGNDGYVSLMMTDEEHAREVMLVMNFVVRNRWIDDWVPGIEMD